MYASSGGESGLKRSREELRGSGCVTALLPEQTGCDGPRRASSVNCLDLLTVNTSSHILPATGVRLLDMLNA